MIRPGSATDPLWYKDAVIYQVHVRAFADSNGDGIGDFRGLTEKLSYIKSLGVSCVWLLPFYPSPLRDDGYDIAHYEGVHPSYGTLKDFRTFLRGAHEHGLQVVTELVINHTSDQHPWFQAARRAPADSPKRNYYVWSDTKHKYEGVRIIFTDTETSNWSWDAVANAYYWHRFFHHQPDLNFDNPHVRRAVQRVMRFWLDMGVDGMRLDAVPYLIEREGTSCENLYETHLVLKELRAELDRNYSNRMLLAEANQWPGDVCAYFGSGDECHMAFNFPLMPRIYMALRQEDRHPISDIVSQTPEIPDICQWAIFLRNHDELTLEMVTAEERDYMYQSYATDPQMRINVGIRRRLAPLMENNRQRIELMNGLIFSLPGTPVIYYGDEIGMGDNIYLGDRNGVRTPMQWTSDRNGGFSRADPARLFAPPVMDPVWGYQALNVEAQERSPSSLLSWMKRVMALRARHRTFGRGSIRFVSPPNRKILAYIREYQGETILCVANLARTAQPAELDLRAWSGRVPIEMVGSTAFPRIGELPYFLTLAPYGFYWFLLAEASAPPVVEHPVPRSAPKPPSALDLPPLLLGVVWDTAFTTATHAILERDYLPVHLETRRWFAAKARPLSKVLIRDHALVRGGPEPVFFTLLDVRYGDGGSEVYVLPMAFLGGKAADDLLRESPELVIARVSGARKGVLHERLDWGVAPLLLDAIAGGRSFAGHEGRFVASRTSAFDVLRGPVDPASPPPVQRSASEQSNTSFIFGDQLIMKLIRRVEPGPNPELEISYHLTERVQFTRAPRLAGAIEYEEHGGTRSTLAVLHGFVHYQTTGWEQALNEAGRYLEDAASEATHPPEAGEIAAEIGLLLSGNVRVPQGVADRLGWYVDAVLRLGRRTADLHLALASAKDVKDFDPAPLTRDDLSTTIAGIRTLATQLGQLLNTQLPMLSPPTQEMASVVIALLPGIVNDLDRAVTAVPDGLMKTRIHGDYHLGQVLWDRNDFYIIDFEGEPGRALPERRAQQSPLKDVAGMVRSFSYASQATLAAWRAHHPEDGAKLVAWARFWEANVSRIFVQGYRAAAAAAIFVPEGYDRFTALLRIFLIEKALYELRYELNNRPDWLHIPLAGLIELLDKGPGA
jgi:maltose alpha-D-glucosyltransferase / alpha-amylase